MSRQIPDYDWHRAVHCGMRRAAGAAWITTIDVRFTPGSGGRADIREGPRCANSEHALLRVAAIVLSSQTLDRKTSTQTLPKAAKQSDYKKSAGLGLVLRRDRSAPSGENP
jgi:hypothetical protein